MHRYLFALSCVLAFTALLVASASAGEDTDLLRKEVQQLQARVEALQTQQSSILEEEVQDYLEQSTAWNAAQGGGDRWSKVSVKARFTAVDQNTIGLDPGNRAVVNGDIDLDFDFQVTDKLTLFIFMTANDSDGMGANGGLPAQFGSVAGPTFSGIFDGIGVNGTVPTAPGSVRLYEAGIEHQVSIGGTVLHVELGALDPRRRFLQTRFADDENTQFLNNLFDDSPAVPWLTDATGRTSYGLHLWASFGKNQEWTVNTGWFNTPGQWFNQGQWYVQVAWQAEVSGREMNIRLMGWVQNFFQDVTGDGDAGGAVSWDWLVTDKIGLFARIAVNSGDANPIQSDFSFGGVWYGPVGSRPDDDAGVALGFINANDNVLIGVPKEMETTLEIYYRYMLEDGKLQITPHLMFVFDPGGNLSPWQDDLLVILGVRIFVPF